jgi:hypothetical protein
MMSEVRGDADGLERAEVDGRLRLAAARFPLSHD